MTTIVKYQIYCTTEDTFKYTWASSPPTTCPTNSLHIVNPDSVSQIGGNDTNYLSYGASSGGSVVVNLDLTTIQGDLGATDTIGGAGTVIVSDQTNIGFNNTPVITSAQSAYSTFMGMAPTFTSGTSNIGGMTFNPGVIALTDVGGVSIGGVTPFNSIILDGDGQYVFQIINGGLIANTTANTIDIQLIGGARASEVYWVVNGSVDLQSITGNITNFKGSIIAQGNITLGIGSISQGSLVAVDNTSIITLNNNNIISQINVFAKEMNVGGYKIIESTLSDNKAVQILASDVNGGIYVEAGVGGIYAVTTNSISLNATAASNLTTSNGDLELKATAGLVSIDAGSGINIGNDVITPLVNVATTSTNKVITMGNFTGTTSVTLLAATGGINATTSGGIIALTSTSETADAIKLDASGSNSGVLILTGSGGYVLNSGLGQTQITSMNTNIDAVRIDTSGSIGGIFLAAGSSGIYIGNDGVAHPIVMGNNVTTSSVMIQSGSGGNVIDSTGSTTVTANTSVNIGNTSNTVVNVGNSAGTTAVNINSGTFGITIGNDANNSEIQIANSSVGKKITIGNANNLARLFLRTGGSGGFLSKHQESATSLADSNTNLTPDNNVTTGILSGILSGTPTTINRVLTLPTAAAAVAGFIGVGVGDSFDFKIINKSTTDIKYTLQINTGVTNDGNLTINPVNSINGSDSGSGQFTIMFTNIISGTEAYTIYRTG